MDGEEKVCKIEDEVQLIIPPKSKGWVNTLTGVDIPRINDFTKYYQFTFISPNWDNNWIYVIHIVINWKSILPIILSQNLKNFLHLGFFLKFEFNLKIKVPNKRKAKSIPIKIPIKNPKEILLKPSGHFIHILVVSFL